MKRWIVLLSVIAVVAAVWLLGPGKSGRATPRSAGNRQAADGESRDEGASRDGAPAALASPPVDLDAVDRDRDLHGIVVRRADGLPIAGADLRVVTYPWRRAGVLHYDRYYEVVEGIGTRSASDGTFSLRLRPGSGVALRVRAEGYAPLELAARQAGERVRVEMDTGARLAIVTRDERGNPVPGTKVRFLTGEGPEIRGVTDERGRYECGLVSCPSVVTVTIIPERLGYRGRDVVHVAAPGDHEHVVTLVDGRTITGVVTDAETGGVVAGARVGMSWVMEATVLSGADGRYALPGWLGDGIDEIHCVADGYGRGQWFVTGDVHDFALSRGDSVTGRLIDAEGRPVALAPLSAAGMMLRDRAMSARAGRSDEGGRFLLTDLRRDMPHALIVMAEGHGRYLLDFDPHPKEPGTIDLGDIRLPEARTIAGRVLNEAREPVPRVQVNLQGANTDRGRLRGGAKLDVDTYGTEESRQTDDLGRFRFPDLSHGRYRLGVQRPGGSEGARRSVDLGEADLLDVDLALPDGREFVVSVVDEEGVPVPMVLVSAGSGNGHTDALGRVTLVVTEAVKRIRAYPEASGRSLLPADVTVERDTGEHRLVLKKAETIRGVVLLEDGRPFARAIVMATRGPEHVASTVSAGDGTFSIAVPPGESLEIRFDGYNSREPRRNRVEYVGEAVRAAPGATGVELRVRPMTRDRALRVRVVHPDGTPAAGINVSASSARADTGADGVVTLTGLPEKETSVTVLVPHDRTDLTNPPPLKVVAAGQEVTLTLLKALTVSGVVLMPDGTGAAWVRVSVRRADGASYAASAHSDGTFVVRVPADAEGPWTVRARANDVSLRGEVKDVPTGASGVRIQLGRSGPK